MFMFRGLDSVHLYLKLYIIRFGWKPHKKACICSSIFRVIFVPAALIKHSLLICIASRMGQTMTKKWEFFEDYQ